MYKIEDTISSIKLIHPGKIAKRFFINDDTVKISGIILDKPFKLQITAVAKVDGQKKKRVLNVEYSGTLKKAVDDAKSARNKWMDELKTDIKKAPAKANTVAVNDMMTLSEAFERYLVAQEIKQKSKKRTFDKYRMEKLFDKHIRKPLGNVLLDNIDTEDVQKIANNMKVRRAKLDEEGEKIPLLDKDGNVIKLASGKVKNVMETRPAAERTKRTVYQLISPIYTYVNSSNKIKYTVTNPASMKDLPTLENDREVTVDIAAFTNLYHYEDPRYRNIFIWLMHGRRLGEVTSLDYGDIDLNDNTYIIRAENNKSRTAMTYILTDWQRATLPDVLPKNGLVFPSVNNKEKRMYSGTITSNHWNLNCTLHDLRHVIGNTLVSSGVSVEIIGRILGHKPQKNIITNRYSKVSNEAANKALVTMLEKVLV